jgi:hypothetical protein
MIEKTVWNCFVESRDKLMVGVNTLFKDLMLGLLDEKALFYLKLGSNKIQKLGTRAVLLAQIHPKVLAAVYEGKI